VTIVGGGVIGSAAAYFLAREHGVHATVLERDPTYRTASSALSASSIRLQFSTPLNLLLSQASLELMQPWRDQMQFVEAGYLFLATDVGAPTLCALNAMQRGAGADIRLLDRSALQARWPWLALDDIALGSWGVRGEGWFDGPGLHQRLRREAMALGANFMQADAQRFEVQGSRVHAVVDAQGQRHATDQLLIAAGAWSAPLAAQLNVALPVGAHKRDVFVLDSPAKLPGCPLIIDPSGVWMRPEGAGFLAGAPPRGDDAGDAPLEAIDLDQFDAQLWPTLAARVPAFEALRVRSAWAGYYDMNTFDHNGLVGALPGWDNAFTACGFSGHGMQHALAVGRAMASYISHGQWGAIDLGALSPERVQRRQPVREINII
jgi:glycine/D-amino acid oxidase-like deaminating enzyme